MPLVYVRTPGGADSKAYALSVSDDETIESIVTSPRLKELGMPSLLPCAAVVVKGIDGRVFYECSKDDLFGTLRGSGGLGASFQITWTQTGNLTVYVS
mmetsp:Transcript_31242/g.77733  ORF Transcript_31242/g.77733 Transcript_31242/m.77733 type:complete len:98 (+) Transcript_31242:269-562(+)|eukprot:CAMPEP_0197611956 /NCGR_PEP_ID=MMETSP1326-20131121/56365_1 /TAXON_ID=1155430 /ORGANISM="Genus nov. species nov., Strain RCC2288" /LENGTH=97 /DNA_ID=CAMNT_0043180663 /DNA_START=252 /DNA_END=545 /DNA_ORIENTATION=-